MLDMRLYQQLNMQSTSDVLTWQHDVMTVHITLLVLNQYLGLFRPPGLSYVIPVTYQGLFSDMPPEKIKLKLLEMLTVMTEKTPDSNLFTILKQKLGAFDIKHSTNQTMLLTAINIVTEIKIDTAHAHVLQSWQDTYSYVAKAQIQIHTNYIPKQIITEIHTHLTPSEGARIYSENVGNANLTIKLGGNHSCYTDYSDCDVITQLFKEVRYFMARLPRHHVVIGSKMHVKKYDLAVINLGTVTSNPKSIFDLPTRDGNANLSLQKLTQLVSPQGKIVVISNQTNLTKVNWDLGSSLAALQSGFISHLKTLAASPSTLMPQAVSFLIFDMQQIN